MEPIMLYTCFYLKVSSYISTAEQTLQDKNNDWNILSTKFKPVDTWGSENPAYTGRAVCRLTLKFVYVVTVWKHVCVTLWILLLFFC